MHTALAAAPATRSWSRTTLSLLFGIAFTLAFMLLAQPASAQTDVEQCFLDEINTERAAVGAGALTWANDIVDYTRDHSETMAASGDLYHSTGAQLDAALPSGWSAWGENVGWQSHPDLPDCTAMHSAFMGSDGHRENLLNPIFEFAATGVHVDGSGGLWTTHVFFAHDSYQPAPAPSSTWSGTFADDDGSNFEDEIEALVAAGITQGCGSNNYCPNDVVNRGQMAAFLNRALNLPPAASFGFRDISGSTFAGDINAIAGAGITQGCGNNNYCPNDVVTRGQMAAFLVRALDLPPAPDFGFTDVSGSTFRNDINRLAAAGVTQGCGGTSFCPDASVTRGQMAAFLVRALDL